MYNAFGNLFIDILVHEYGMKQQNNTVGIEKQSLLSLNKQSKTGFRRKNKSFMVVHLHFNGKAFTLP